MAFGPLALMIAALFAGAAFYVGFAEQPARLQLNDKSALQQWKPSYHRGFLMQASLAVAGFLAGAGAWLQDGNLGWLVGAVLLLANWPFTIFAIMPTNKALGATELGEAGAASRALMVKWGHLHAVRTILGASSTLVFLWMMI